MTGKKAAGARSTGPGSGLPLTRYVATVKALLFLRTIGVGERRYRRPTQLSSQNYFGESFLGSIPVNICKVSRSRKDNTEPKESQPGKPTLPPDRNLAMKLEGKPQVRIQLNAESSRARLPTGKCPPHCSGLPQPLPKAEDITREKGVGGGQVSAYFAIGTLRETHPQR